MIWLTGAIAFFALCQVAVGFLQYVYGGEQTDKIIAADERLATAMESSVAQAKNAFDAANAQAVLTQRAWIAVTIRPHNTPFALGHPFDTRVSFKNTGRTPALNVKAVTVREVITHKGGRLGIPHFSYPPDKYIFSGNLTPDGEIFGDDISEPLTEDDIKKITSNMVRVFTHGTVEYDDVFGVHHWQNYCGFLVPMGVIAICPYHSEMDQNK
jgi:hypothetical protein